MRAVRMCALKPGSPAPAQAMLDDMGPQALACVL